MLENNIGKGEKNLSKVAYVEIGNYSLKLIIAETKPDAFFNILAKRVVPVELGKNLEKDRFLKRGQIDDAIYVLKQFRKTCDMYGVEKTCCIGTFLSESKPKNLNSFCDEVYTKCGFKMDALENEDQNLALYFANLNSIDVSKSVTCLVEYDSIRLVQYNRRGILHSIDFAFGPLNVLDIFAADQYDPETRLDAISEYMDSELSRIDWVEDTKGFQFIGVGRYFDDLVKMIKKYRKYPFELSHNYKMEKTDIEYIFSQVESMGLDSGKSIKGLEEGRIDTFILFLIFVKKIMDKFQFENVTFSRNGILEGTILRDCLVPTTDKPIFDIIETSLAGSTIYYTDQQTTHAKQVSFLATLLFKELRVLHKLPKGYLKILKVSAYLHDIGYNVDYFKHSAHSGYIMRSKEINGLTHREQILAGFVASLHHGENLNLSDYINFNSILLPEDAEAVQKLGIILQIAESLDKSMSNIITGLTCDILGDSVIFKTEAEVDKTFELQEANLAGKNFLKFFKKRLEIL